MSMSGRLELSDVHLIFGPNGEDVSVPSHFHQDAETCEYDTSDQTRNIILMHRIVHELRKLDRVFEKKVRQDRHLQRRRRRADFRGQL